MKNLKKLLAVVIVAAMMITTMLPAMAAKIENAAEANALHALGLYQGTSTTGFEPALDQPLTREQGAAMLIRLLGEEALAKALSSSDVSATLVIFSDVDAISDWARPYVAYGVRESLIAGNANGTFNPQGPLLGKDFATMILRALGYTVNASTYEAAAAELAKAGGLDMGTAVVVNNKELTRDDMVGMAYQSLQAKYKGTDETVIGRLVKNGVVSEADAISNGVYNGELAKAAEAAVSAYEAAPITTLEEIEASASALAAANAAVAKIVVEADKAAFQARIDAKLAAAEANKAAILAADEAAKQAIENAKAAVEAYENAADTTAAEVESAKALKAAADEAVAAVKDEAIKADFEARVAARAAELEALAVEYKAQADAEAAVAAYENAPFATLEQIAAAKALEAAAVEKIAAVKDATVKAALETKVAAQKALVTANEIKISPADVSVSMDNLKTLVATFSKALDKKTVTEKNIRLEIDNNRVQFDNTDETATRFKLSEDGKTLVIVFQNFTVNQGDEIRVAFENFKDTDGVELPKYEKQFVVKDKMDPVLERVEYVNQNLIKLYFSEPVNLDTTNESGTGEGYVYSEYADRYGNKKATLKFNDKAEYIEFKSIPEENLVEVRFNNAISEGQYTLEVADIKDFAGYVMDETTFVFNAAKDTTAPSVVAIEYISPTQFKVKYSEKITAHGINQIKQGSTVIDSKNYSITLTDNNTAALVTIADAYKLDVRATVNLTVRYKEAKDLVGNKSSEKTFETRIEDDLTVPSIVRTQVLDNNRILIVFSKDVESGEQTYDKFTLYKEDGSTVVSTYAKDFTPDEEIEHGYILYFKQLDSVSAGNYVVKIKDLKDLSIRENTMPETKFTISVRDAKEPMLISAKYEADEENSCIYINYSEPMDYASVTNLSNYIIKSSSGDLISLATYQTSNGLRAKIASVTSDGRRVVIKVPYIEDKFEADKIYYIYVIGVKDTAGNYVKNAALDIDEPIPLTTDYAQFDQSVVTAVATGKNTIELTIADNNVYVFSSANNKAFKFVDAYGNEQNELNVGSRACPISADGKKITITTAFELSADATATIKGTNSKAKIRLQVDNGPYDYYVKDGNGNPISLDLVVEDKIMPSQTSSELKGNGSVNYRTQEVKFSATEFDITFDEDIEFLGTDLASVIEIRCDDEEIGTLIPNVDYTATLNGSKIHLVINKDEFKVDKLVTLYYKITRPDLFRDKDGYNGYTGINVKAEQKISNIITVTPDWE